MTTQETTSTEEKAHMGIMLIKEAILEVLYDGSLEQEKIGPKKVTERTGLPAGGKDRGHQDWLAFAFLKELIKEGKVVNPERGRYEVSPSEFTKRRYGEKQESE